MYKFLNAALTLVVHLPSSRCVYLDQPSTIHTELYVKWRDGWTEVIPEHADLIDGVEVTTPEQTIVHPAHVTGPYVAPAARPPTVPGVVTRRQAKQALTLAGKLALVQPAINAIADATQRTLIQIEWDDSLEFQRNRPSVIAIGAAVGLSSAQLDQLFITAATL